MLIPTVPRQRAVGAFVDRRLGSASLPRPVVPLLKTSVIQCKPHAGPSCCSPPPFLGGRKTAMRGKVVPQCTGTPTSARTARWASTCRSTCSRDAGTPSRRPRLLLSSCLDPPPISLVPHFVGLPSPPLTPACRTSTDARRWNRARSAPQGSTNPSRGSGRAGISIKTHWPPPFGWGQP